MGIRIDIHVNSGHFQYFLEVIIMYKEVFEAGAGLHGSVRMHESVRFPSSRVMSKPAFRICENKSED